MNSFGDLSCSITKPIIETEFFCGDFSCSIINPILTGEDLDDDDEFMPLPCYMLQMNG